MCTYSLLHITEIKGNKCQFSKLVKNGKCFFDEFKEEMMENNKKEFRKLISYMDYHSNGFVLPKMKFNNIQDNKYSGIFWEFKYEKLRLYTAILENGKVVVYGGTKNTQEKDIAKFKKIAKDFLEQ